MKYYANILFLLLLSGCARSILIQDALVNKDGYFMYGGNPERDFYAARIIPDSLQLKWIMETSGSSSATSVTVYDKYVFIPDMAGKIFCFDIETGKRIGAEKSKGAVYTVPVLYRLRIFFLVNEYDEPFTVLYYYDYFTGEYISEIAIPGKVSNEMIIDETGVYVLSDSGVLYKFNLIGMKDWELDTKTPVISSPALSDGKLYFGGLKGDLVAVDIAQKKVVYKNKISEGFEAGITVKNNRAYIGDKDGWVYCLDTDKGAVIWKQNTGSTIKSIPVMNENNLYIGNLAGSLFALEKTSGKLIWRLDTDGLFNTTPLLTMNYLVQPDLNRKVYFIDPDDGEIIKTIEFDRRVKMTPIVYGDNLFIGLDKGEVYVYSLTSE